MTSAPRHPRLYRALLWLQNAIAIYDRHLLLVGKLVLGGLLLIPIGLTVGLAVDRTADPSHLTPVGPWIAAHKAWMSAGWFALVAVGLFSPGLLMVASYALAGTGAAALGNGHIGHGLGVMLQAVLLWGLAALLSAGFRFVVLPLVRLTGRSVDSGLAWAHCAKPVRRADRQANRSGSASEGAPTPAYPVRMPRLTFDELHGMRDVKARLLDAGRAVLAQQSTASNGILLYGKPGNGKTVLAEALAGELALPFLSVSIADIQSRWIGQTTEQLVAVFRYAQAQAPCVLLIDEIDSIIADRSAASTSDEGPKTTNAFLTEVVRARGGGVIVMAATNFLDRLDPAAIREGRFDYKVEITAPDHEARVGLLRSALQHGGRGIEAARSELDAVAQRWNGFSVARLNAIGKEAGRAAELAGRRVITRHELLAGLRSIQAQRSALPENVTPLEQLIMPGDQAKVLQGLAWRMSALFEAEALGAAVPRGVLFYGPPGTGKTSAVQALARSTGWALFITSGDELATQPNRIEALHAQAEDARPAIIFIDEADDLLADRRMSATRGATNRLLTSLDGAQGRTPDLLYVAATNHPEQIDAAMLRGGRFSEKVGFARPDSAQMTVHVEHWLREKGWSAEQGAEWVAGQLEGLSIADATAVLQAAVNVAVEQSLGSGRGPERVLDARAIELALNSVQPQARWLFEPLEPAQQSGKLESWT